MFKLTLISLLSHLFVMVFSWLFVCGLVWLITLCFGWTFSWLIATGVWLVMALIRAIFR